MGKGGYLGEFEELVLLAVTRCGDNAYGMEVRREISTRIGRDVSIGAVYATIERLTSKGLLVDVLPKRSDEADGRPRKFFRISKAGVAALDVAHDLRSRMRSGLRHRRSRT